MFSRAVFTSMSSQCLNGLSSLATALLRAGVEVDGREFEDVAGLFVGLFRAEVMMVFLRRGGSDTLKEFDLCFADGPVPA